MSVQSMRLVLARREGRKGGTFDLAVEGIGWCGDGWWVGRREGALQSFQASWQVQTGGEIKI